MRHIVSFGESAVLVQPEPSEDPFELLRELSELDDIDEVLAGPTLLVKVAAGRTRSLGEGFLAIPGRSPSSRHGRVVEMQVKFDGPDIDEVALSAGMSHGQVVDAIEHAPLRVAYLGFAPGFAYIEGLPSFLLGVERRPSPRTSVPAGSVAVAGGYLGVYPRSSPGGWNLLGRTDLELFDPLVAPFATLQPGDRIRIVPTDTIGGPTPAEDPRVRPRCDSSRRAVVEDPRGLTTLQDGGRVGVGHLGVPAAGAADIESLRLANLIAGNPELYGGLETTVDGPVLRFDCDAHVVVVGAGAAVDGRSVPSAAVVEVPAGGRLQIGQSAGLRGYVAVAGGFRGTELFGSCSSDQLSGLGPGPLQAGDELAIGVAGRPRGYSAELTRGSTLRILPGPVPVGRDALAKWVADPFVVLPDSNRIGVRLGGGRPFEPPGPPGPPGGSHCPRGSHGMVHGAIQMPPSGEPIVLLCDHATMGGYPVVATVISSDLGALAQRRPGDSVQFEIVGLGEALQARAALDRRLARAPSGWYPAGDLS